MDQLPRRIDLLQELETRQDEVLAQLDALNTRLEKLLAEYTAQQPTKLGPSKAAA